MSSNQLEVHPEDPLAGFPRRGMIIFVSVSMFDHKPERCPFGHLLWPGMVQVGWKPCICRAGSPRPG